MEGGLELETEELLIYIGNKIKDYRKKQGLTQKELGKKVGVGHTTVSAYEKGTISLNMNMLFAISAALDIRVDDLFPERNSNQAYLEKTKGMITKDLNSEEMLFLQKLIEKTSLMNKEERSKFLDSIQFTVDYYDKMNKNN